MAEIIKKTNKVAPATKSKDGSPFANKTMSQSFRDRIGRRFSVKVGESIAPSNSSSENNIIPPNTSIPFYNIALRFLTLDYIDITTNEKQDALNKAFTSYYARLQRRVYRRSLWLVVIFMIITIGYDYLRLLQDAEVYSIGKESQSSFSNEKIFYYILIYKFGIIFPFFILSICHTYSKSFDTTHIYTWVNNLILLIFPIFYNLITNDYGVSWICLFLVYFLSCTPTKFFHNALFCLFLVILCCIHLYLMYTMDESIQNESTGSTLEREALYVFLFYFLVCIPSQSRESAVRISYLTELMLKGQTILLKKEENRSKVLLNNMLPKSIVKELKAGKNCIANKYEMVTVLFAEVCNFDNLSLELHAKHVVELLNIIFSAFDRLVDDHHVHKIETVGPIYMVASGCPEPCTNHADLAANLALGMQDKMPEIRKIVKGHSWGLYLSERLDVRIGLNSGNLMAGVVGIRNPRFKLFGNTVNVASRMQSTNDASKIQITQECYDLIKDKYIMEYRGTVQVKGKGEMKTYFLIGFQKNTPHSARPLRKSIAVMESKSDRKIDSDIQFPRTDESFQLPTDAAPIVRNPFSRKTNFIHSISIKKVKDENKEDLQSTFSRFITRRTMFRRSLNEANIPRKKQLEEERIQENNHHKTDSIEDEINNFDSNDQNNSNNNESDKEIKVVKTKTNSQEEVTDIMNLPKFLTQRNVFFSKRSLKSFNSNSITTSEASTWRLEDYEFSFNTDHHDRYLRFFRRSIILFMLVKPFIAIYQTYYFAGKKLFFHSNMIFITNLCVMIPMVVLFLIFTYSKRFTNVEQSSSLATVIAIAIMLNIESMLLSSGHGYISAVALYQCHFAFLTFAYRFFIGFFMLAMYLICNLWLSHVLSTNAGFALYAEIKEDPDAVTLRVLRNAIYIFIFFAAQAWVVFNSEFKQRVNHYRSIIWNQQQAKLLEEQEKVTNILLNLLPSSIVDKLKEHPGKTIAESFESVTVLFTDMVHFTAFSSKIEAIELVEFLNEMYTRFDTLANKNHVYKVEIIGDAYYAVGGCPIVSKSHAYQVIQCALEMINELTFIREETKKSEVNIRIGIHTGRVLAGVVGTKDPRYHLFGETVSIAQYLESSGQPGKVHISEATYKHVKYTHPNSFHYEYNKMIQSNGKDSKLRSYFVTNLD